MTWGHLSESQRRKLSRWVTGERVHDLGAGDLSLSRDLIAMGAARVIAVDRHIPPAPWGAAIEIVESSFLDYRGPVDVALVSWPTACQRNEPLLELVKQARIVAYLGSNYDAAICGSPDLFRHLSLRTVLAHCPRRRNTLIVYGAFLQEARWLLPEERAGLDRSKIHRFHELYPEGDSP